ncbi:MAG TPA: tetratricopeptide repeat protein, partial [Coleofasciculaceae cyanobacterium]
QESIAIYFCLYQYFELISDRQSNLKLSELVYQACQNYRAEAKTGSMGYELVSVSDRLANCYLQAQNYQKAQETYQRNVELLQNLTGVEAKVIQPALASTYHQLGRVAEEMREYEQARLYYQNALDIYVEFNDRYSQASTYAQLGLLAEELGELPQAQADLLQALQIFAEYNDQHFVNQVMQNLARLYRTHPDPDLLTAIAEMFGITVEEAQAAIDSYQPSESAEPE